MPLRLRASAKWKDFKLNLSYQLGDDRTNKLYDCRNVYNGLGDRLETRHGYSRFNATSVGGSIGSISFYQQNDGTREVLAKSGTVLYQVPETGASVSIKSALSSATKHRAITFNNRHIIAVEDDGLFSYNGTTFTQLGQDPPVAGSVALAAGGSLTDATQYRVWVSFYSTTTGFESNATSFGEVTTTTGNQTINVSSIPTSASNAFINKNRVYIQNVTGGGDPLFYSEIDLVDSTESITENSTSTQTTETNAFPPLSGGGKFMTSFNERLIYAGNSDFPSDVFFSEPNQPDAINTNADTGILLNIAGDGPITGLATGFFNDSNLDPFLVIFKNRSTHIYSELGGSAKLETISTDIGCNSHDSIAIKNGSVVFMSNQGWFAVTNGKLEVDPQGDEISLSKEINEVFTSPGYVYELNLAQPAHSVFYGKLDQYITWVAEGSDTEFKKAYVYEFNTGGFKAYEFYLPATDSAIGEDSSGNELVLFSGSDGFIYKHSTEEDRTDVDGDNAAQNIPASALIGWVSGDDMDARYIFRECVVRAVSPVSTLTASEKVMVKAFINYDLSDFNDYVYDFVSPNSGFILDFSKLDEGILSDGRQINTQRADINRTGESIILGFYQTGANLSMGLIQAQMDFIKTGNRN